MWTVSVPFLSSIRQKTALDLIFLTQLTYGYSFLAPELADKYGQQAVALAKDLNDPEGEAHAYQVCGVAFAKNGNYERALGLLHQISSIV